MRSSYVYSGYMEPRWYRLDNAAKLFPAVESVRITTLFRVSATLDEEVEPQRLQEALEKTIPRFPYFRVRLKRGLFWYYLDHNPNTPQVRSDSLYPCQRLHRRRNNEFLFRVRYYDHRVALEFSHVLSDGTGATLFLRTLLAVYFRLEGEEIPNEEGLLDVEEPPKPEEGEDAYSHFHTEDLPAPPKASPAYHPAGTLIGPGRYYIVTSVIPASEVVAAAKSAGVSVTEYLVAVYLWALERSQEVERRPKRFRPVRLSVPVNLRKILGVNPLRNFSLFLMPGVDPRLGKYDLPEILKQVHHAMRRDLNEKTIRQQISRNVGSERNPLIRALPLLLKRLFAPIIYRAMGENLYSGSLSNLGVITMPEELARHVERFEFIPGPGPINKTRATAVSFNGSLYLTFGRLIEGTRVERYFFRKLREEGISVHLESNDESPLLGARREPNRCPRCDVSLRPTLTHCPICGARPELPPGSEPLHPLYPQEVPVQKIAAPEERRRLSATAVIIATGFAILPAVISVLVDVRVTGEITWSFFPLTALPLLWLFVVPPLLLKKHRFAKLLAIDVVAVALFLVLLDTYTGGRGWAWYSVGGVVLFWIYGGLPAILGRQNRLEKAAAIDLVATAVYLAVLDWVTPGGPWFLELALPIVLSVTIAFYGALLPIRRGLVGGVDRVAAVLYGIGLAAVGIDLSIRDYRGLEGFSLWSIIVLLVVLVLGAACHAVEHNRTLNAIFHKRLHL